LILNWRNLNENITSFSEDELKQFIIDELKNRKRSSILNRLHQRFTVVRANRERMEILAQAKEL
jgi:plasmid maintenance system killer protein